MRGSSMGLRVLYARSLSLRMDTFVGTGHTQIWEYATSFKSMTHIIVVLLISNPSLHSSQVSTISKSSNVTSNGPLFVPSGSGVQP